MSESKTYIFGENQNGGSNGMLGLLAPLPQKQGVDPNVLLAMKGSNGMCGEGGWFMWVIFLFFLMGWGGNGWGTSRAEYMNSLSHEMLHVVQHVSEVFMINMYGEEACCLPGGLVQACCKRKG